MFVCVDVCILYVFMLSFLTFNVLVANPEKTTLHGGQSRSWSAEHVCVCIYACLYTHAFVHLCIY